MHIKTYKLREIKIPVSRPLQELGYRDFIAEDDWRQNLISFTSLVYLPGRRKIICGLTASDVDILYEFYPAEKAFLSFNYPDVGEKFEIKSTARSAQWATGA